MLFGETKGIGVWGRLGAGECMCASVNVVQMVVTKRLVIVCDVYVVIDMTEKMMQRSNTMTRVCKLKFMILI